MDEEERLRKNQAYTVIAARCGSMAAKLYTAMSFPELRGRVTSIARQATDDAVEMVEFLFLTKEDPSTSYTSMIEPVVCELDEEFYQPWIAEHPKFTVTECLWNLREFGAGVKLSDESLSMTVRFLLVLMDFAKRKVLEYGDSLLTEFDNFFDETRPDE